MVLDMKRNKIIDVPSFDNKLTEHKQCVAFHEAGHAAAIYLNNKAQNLPPVFFQILFKDRSGSSENHKNAYHIIHDDCIARVEGGRLIQSLPDSMDAFLDKLVAHDDVMVHAVEDYVSAFEADIVNLLVGPLAEARYIADTDNELFNHRLVNINALKNYGGRSDIATAYEYLQSYSPSKQQQDEKLNELFNVAFDFVNDYENWKAISKLANHIIDSDKDTINCEEVIAVLESTDVNDFADEISQPDRYVRYA
jgi:hypothetical protein